MSNASNSILQCRSSTGFALTNPVLSLQIEQRRWSPFDPLLVQQGLVDCLRQNEENGVRFPDHVRQNFFFLLDEVELKAYVEPRVVGLLIDRDSNASHSTGLVTPIFAKESPRGWNVGNSLPFHAGHIQDALFRLLVQSGQQVSDKIPELISFEISERLNEPTSGTSMHIAGLLAVVDAFNENNTPILSCSCAVVEPIENELKAVGSIKTKLDAFLREYGSGSLLIRHADCEIAAKFDEHFDNVWPVTTFAELGTKLLDSGLMQKVLASFPITLATVDAAQKRVAWLSQEKKYLEALEFTKRLEAANHSMGRPYLRVSQAIQIMLEDQNRHNGRYYQAIVHSRKAVSQIEALDGLSSFNELVDAKVRLASALFDGHDFGAAAESLVPLVKRIESDESLVTAESQVNLYNTLGRCKIRLEQVDWEELFRKSIKLQSEVDPDNIPRTTAYLIQGLLLNGRFTEASQSLEEMMERDSFTDKFLTFYKADMHRRIGEQRWDDPQFELESGHYAHGFYFQATARQAERTSDEKVRRFKRAAQELCSHVPSHSDINILQLFSYFCNWAAELEAKANGLKVREAIQNFLNQPEAASLKSWYIGKLPTKPKSSLELEPLFNAVPYF